MMPIVPELSIRSRGSLGSKNACRAATTEEVELLEIQTIDGVALAIGDRVLVKDQSSAASNGVYIVTASLWYRSPDMDSNAETQPGSLVPVVEGNTNGKSLFMLTSPGPITVDESDLVFERLAYVALGS